MRRDILIWAIAVFCLGCGEESPPAPVTAPATTPSAVSAEDQADTGRKFPVQLLFVATDGTESSIDLADLQVGSVRQEVTEGAPEAFEMSLEFVRHNQGQDVYDFQYTDPGNPSTTRGSGPYTYDGTETLLKQTEFGKFLLRPIP